MRCVCVCGYVRVGWQAEVSQKMVSMGFNVQEEFVDEQTGYSLDVFIPEYRCAVEVDGENLDSVYMRYGGSRANQITVGR